MSRLSLRVRAPGLSPRFVFLFFHDQGLRPEVQEGFIYLRESRAQIGSSESADLRLDMPGVASLQCSIDDDHGRLTLRDRGRGSKTMVNGTPCTMPTDITVGDIIGVGQCTIELTEYLDRASPPQPISSSPNDDDHTPHVYARVAQKSALRWDANGRPKGLLARGKMLSEGAFLLDREPAVFDPLAKEWLSSSATRSVLRERRWSLGLGLGLGLVVSYLLLPQAEVQGRPPRASLAPSSHTAAAQELSTEETTETPKKKCIAADYRVRPGDTWELLSSRFSEPVDILRRRNNGSREQPEPGIDVSVCTELRPAPSSRRTYTVRPGETWELVALKFGVDVEHLRAANPELGRELRPGDRLDIDQAGAVADGPTLRRAPTFLPEEVDDATAVGATNDGFLANGITLPRQDDYLIRCQPHSYGTRYTVQSIISAASRMRGEFRYQGELIIGDLSKRSGGAYGPHRSHQNGRDVDVWLPVRSGEYARAPRCEHCNTDYCRPTPEEVDWDATWLLIKSLAAIGTDQVNPVKEIYLDRDLHDELRAAIARDGVTKEKLRTYVQHHGNTALVRHSKGHVHHIHVRFRCGGGEACIE